MHLDNEAEISKIIMNTKIQLAPFWKLHKIKLNKQPFDAVRAGYKTIELRLNDEKRQTLNVGEWIEFSQIDNLCNKVTVEIVALHHFDSFKELYAVCRCCSVDIPKKQLILQMHLIWRHIILKGSRLCMV